MIEMDEIITKLDAALEELRADAFCYPPYSILLPDDAQVYLAVPNDGAAFKDGGNLTMGDLKLIAQMLKDYRDSGKER